MSRIDVPVKVAEAIEWLALHRSGALSDIDRQRFQQWLQASEENREAWQRLEQRLGRMFVDVPAVSRQVLNKAGTSRRHLLRGALGVAGLGLGGWWLGRNGLLPRMNSDLHSGFAQRRNFILEDGSRVMLNAQSQVDLLFDAQQRTLLLHEGAISIKVRADPLRALVVRTAFGEVRALGTRFTVTLREESVHIWVQESRVLATAIDGSTLELGPGQGALLGRAGSQRLDPRQAGEGTWQDGLLEVHDQPLGQIIEALRPYRRGLLRISPDAARLRVSGVFPMDDTDQALRSLQEVLPLKVEQYLSWWTQLSLR
jgi:transmembrane sensor